MEEEQALMIPGLPNDIAILCITKVPHYFLPGLRLIYRRWRDLVTDHLFLRYRERIGSVEHLIFIVQALGGTAANLSLSVNALSVYIATDNSWHRLSSPEPIPMFAHCVAVERRLILVGKWDPVRLYPMPNVWIVDLITGEWRKGRPMSTARSFFACATVGWSVYVAGGHDEMKNVLRTAEIYDVEADEWEAMAEERDESQGVEIRSRFWVISGYRTQTQRQFTDSAEWYDPEKGVWLTEEGVCSEESGSSACLSGGDGLWCVGRIGAMEYRERSGPSLVAQAAEGMKGYSCMATMGGGKIFVMGAARDGGGAASGREGYGGWILDIGAGKWIRVETPAKFSGFAYSAAAVRI
ncbi:hypothetical protein KFK09_004516 [Dendrobium nobile]|uniref:F-box domain-containing protein n=1 Tax=Dendrobium nobile TaxID=94219 RepID=A0A8T3C5Q2_DENNO|nr:hypothetical protein KFK09_004516 [Dendrobium nobile]